MDINLHLVRYLVAVLDEGHFGRAAEKLYVSTPALSQQVRKLERALGTELVDRTAHPIRPTPAGERFLPEARRSLDAADRAVAYRRQLATTLRLGFVTASAGPRARDIITKLRHQAPEMSVERVELAWPHQASAVRDGHVDASLVRPPISDTTGLRLDVVDREPRVVALPATHRLATRDVVTLADLDDETHVTDDDADPEWVRWWACDPRPSGTPVRYGPSVRTMDELLETVAAEQAVCITGGFVPASHGHPDIVFVPVSDAEPCPISLCTRVADSSPLVGALRQVVASLPTS